MSKCDLEGLLVAGAASLQVTSDGKPKVWTDTTRLYLVYGQCNLDDCACPAWADAFMQAMARRCIHASRHASPSCLHKHSRHPQACTSCMAICCT